MNVNVTITPTQRALIDAHKARRALWEQKATKPALAIGQDNKPAAERIEAKPNFVPQWLAFPTQFNAHVIAYRMQALETEIRKTEETFAFRKGLKEIVREVLQDFPGYTLEDLKGPRRTKDFVLPRQIAQYEIAKQRPDLSMISIGKFFNRDHTTILNSVRKITRMKQEGKL